MLNFAGSATAETGNLNGLQVTLGSVQLELELGDIIQEGTDAIVNSTDERIDLTTGREQVSSLTVLMRV